MRDILPELDRWMAAGEKIALATVAQTWGSSPRAVGAKMAMTPSGKIAGSVSGGCVEGAVVEAGLKAIRKNQPRLLHFGVADETAWTVGLACGGQIDVFVQPLDADYYGTVRDALLAGRIFAAATVIRGLDDLLGRAMLVESGKRFFGSISAELDGDVIAASRRALKDRRSQPVVFKLTTQKEAGLPVSSFETASLRVSGAQVHEEDVEVFIEVVEPQPVLIVVGAVHSAIALTKLATVMGFRTVVIDPRRAFGTLERFPQVDQLIQKWPDEAFEGLVIGANTAIAVLTHDPKIDDPAIMVALRSPAFYVGALGSPSTQAKRRERLQQAGVGPEDLARLHGPIGLKLGSRTPEEIGLAVMAEITAVQNRVME